MKRNELILLQSKIVEMMSALELTEANARSAIKESAQVIPSFLQDELDSAKGEIDLNNAIRIYNHCSARHMVLGHALDRLKGGTFGTCITCGEEMELRRLKVYPEAIRCLDCQEFVEGFSYVG